MRARPRFDENHIAYRNEFNARVGRGKIPAYALVVRFIVICGGGMRREPFSAKKVLVGQWQGERDRNQLPAERSAGLPLTWLR
jgi:hypothetical protein